MQKFYTNSLKRWLTCLTILWLAFGIALPVTTFAQAEGLSGVKPKIRARIKAKARRANRYLQRWNTQSIRDYSFEFQWICFCIDDYRRPVIITVREGVITDVRVKDTGEAVDPANWERYHTIPGLFRLISDAADQGADRINVTYDAALFYPLTGYIDYSFNTIDEEMSFKVDNLVLLR
jgi:hypothetical protein